MRLGTLLDVASFSPYPFQQDSAWIGHLPFAGWLISQASPDVFVELGTHWGHSYFSFCQSVSESDRTTRCYAVDTWAGDEHTGSYGDEVFDQVNAHNQENYAHFSHLLRMKFDEAVSCFADGSIDLLHIDGLHTYEAVKHDFETWLPKLGLGAVVLLHDTNVRGGGFGVWKFWKELQSRYPNNFEFIHSHGLGVLQLDGAEKEKKLEWLESSSPIQKKIRDYFSALGARQLERFELSQSRDRINNLNREVSRRDGLIAELNRTLSGRDEQIAELNRTLSGRDEQIAELSRVLSGRDEQIAGLNRTLAGREEEIAELNRTLSGRDEQVAELSRTLSWRDEQISSFQNSWSWKVTYPLRMVKKLLSRKVGGQASSISQGSPND